jgi:hypothetical protein
MLTMGRTIFESELKFGFVITLLVMLHKEFRPSCALDTGALSLFLNLRRRCQCVSWMSRARQMSGLMFPS